MDPPIQHMASVRASVLHTYTNKSIRRSVSQTLRLQTVSDEERTEKKITVPVDRAIIMILEERER